MPIGNGEVVESDPLMVLRLLPAISPLELWRPAAGVPAAAVGTTGIVASIVEVAAGHLLLGEASPDAVVAVYGLILRRERAVVANVAATPVTVHRRLAVRVPLLGHILRLPQQTPRGGCRQAHKHLDDDCAWIAFAEHNLVAKKNGAPSLLTCRLMLRGCCARQGRR